MEIRPGLFDEVQMPPIMEQNNCFKRLKESENLIFLMFSITVNSE